MLPAMQGILFVWIRLMLAIGLRQYFQEGEP
jgi:hypothetical protein